MKFIIGKKLDMTQVWQGENVIAVTRIAAGPCVVTQVKNQEKDGYTAVQVGFGKRKEKNVKKPQRGHLKTKNYPAVMKEFRLGQKIENLKVGDVIDAGTFAPGDVIQVTGVSKGRGFQGVVKRHHFKGKHKTHGTKDQVRMSGSIGPKGPAHVFKGRRMGGHMGDSRVTVKNLEIAESDPVNNTLLVKGAVPGARNSFVLISGEGELKLKAESEKADEINDKKEEKKGQEKE